MKVVFKIGELRSNPFISSAIDLDDRLFNFTVKWNDYDNTAYLWLYDADMQPIVLGRALVNGLKIRTDRRLLPQDLRFVHLNGETYEPDLDTIGEEFGFIYGN